MAYLQSILLLEECAERHKQIEAELCATGIKADVRVALNTAAYVAALDHRRYITYERGLFEFERVRLLGLFNVQGFEISRIAVPNIVTALVAVELMRAGHSSWLAKTCLAHLGSIVAHAVVLSSLSPLPHRTQLQDANDLRISRRRRLDGTWWHKSSAYLFQWPLATPSASRLNKLLGFAQSTIAR